MFDVTALGELLIDFTPYGKDENNNPIFTAIPGGAPANFLATLAKCGKKTAFIGKVGDDMFGNMLIDTLKLTKINTDAVVKDKNFFTTLAFVALSKSGERSFSFARKPGADMMLEKDDVLDNIINSTKIFHFGTLSMTNEPSKSATKYAAKKAKENGAMISFDPNYRAPLWEKETDAVECMLWGIDNADIIKISDEEVRMLTTKSFEDFAKNLIKSKNVKLIFITCGKEGSYYYNKNAAGFVSAFSVNTVDTNGAGDIFAGCAVSKIIDLGKLPDALSDAQLKEIVLFANAAAGVSTTKHGAIASIPSINEISSLISTILT